MSEVVFDLTPMTRRADAKRNIVIKGFETQKRRLVVGGAGLVVGLVVGGILSPWIGVLSVIPMILCVVAAIWLFDARTSKGLRLRNWDAIRDRRRTAKPQFVLCGHVVQPSATTLSRIRPLAVPIARTDTPVHLRATRSRRRTGPTVDGWGPDPTPGPRPAAAGDGW